MIQRLTEAPAQQGHPPALQDRQQQPDRGLQGQRRPRLRRRPASRAHRGAAAAARSTWSALYVGNMDDGHARVKMEEVRAAPGRDPLRLDRRHGAGQRLLLPHPQPGDPDRVRPPAPGQPARTWRPIPTSPPASTSTSWSARRTGTTTARTCCGSTTWRTSTGPEELRRRGSRWRSTQAPRPRKSGTSSRPAQATTAMLGGGGLVMLAE